MADDGISRKAGPMLRDCNGRFPPGVSGNPAGRPKGARDKVHACIDDLFADWLVHGKEAIQRLREERPYDYIRVLIAALPPDIKRKAWDGFHGR
jgi:Family of unknown function (DUF5681)